MTSEHRRRIDQLYQAVSALEPTKRAAFLNDACDDPTLRSEVESMVAKDQTSAPPETAAASDLVPTVTSVASIREDRLIAGHYRVIDKIGEGGIGSVYRAVDEHLKRYVAIKVLHAEYEHNPERLRQFTNEARAASALNHPNIVVVHEIGDTDGVPFIVMELVDGDTLRRSLRAGALPQAEAVDIAVQVALALGAAHQKGIVHRDIKPENVIVRSDGFAKILDFGLATLRPQGSAAQLLWTTRAVEPLAQAVMGTPAYMSPEQIDGGPVDQRSDIFSLGVLLCELTTGTNPFVRSGVLETLKALTHTPNAAATAIARLDPPLSRIITRALERNPSNRYQTMEELVSDLQQIVQGHSPIPRRSYPPRDSYEATRSSTVPIWLKLVMAPLAIGALGFLISATFNRTIGLTERFGWESPAGWFIWGAKSLVAPTALVLTIWIVVAVAGALGRRLASNFSTIRRIDRATRRRLSAAMVTLRLDDPYGIAQVVAVLGMTALSAILWRFSDVIHAFVNPISEMLPEHLEQLRPDNLDLITYRQTLTVLVLVLTLSVRYVFKLRARSNIADRLAWPRACVIILAASLTLLEMPYRIFFHSDFEKVLFQEQPCYVIGRNSVEFLLHCPKVVPPRNRIALGNDPAVKRLGVVRSVYERSSD